MLLKVLLIKVLPVVTLKALATTPLRAPAQVLRMFLVQLEYLALTTMPCLELEHSLVL